MLMLSHSFPQRGVEYEPGGGNGERSMAKDNGDRKKKLGRPANPTLYTKKLTVVLAPADWEKLEKIVYHRRSTYCECLREMIRREVVD